MPLAGRVTTGTYKFDFLLVKEVLLSSLLRLASSVTATDKTQYFVHLSFNSTLQLINETSSDFHKLLIYFNDPAIAAFFRIPLAAFGAGCANVFPKKLTYTWKI